MTLLQHFDSSTRLWLEMIINNPDDFDLPTMAEVLDYLRNTPDNVDSEKIMGDLIIQFSEEDKELLIDLQ